MGPWKDGKPSAWGTLTGPRTVVAMLVDLHDALLAAQPSRYPGKQGSGVCGRRDPRQQRFDLPTSPLIAAAGKTDRAAVVSALRPVLADVVGPVMAESVRAALGADNQDQADAIVTELAQRLAGKDAA
ncbi:hypothetical protein [Saccharopolyspora sp. ASAGF58]|uniref:hypothetical protein n=1 Tax=Saccharopolyspora sp. ASAGF58 TaxID=2719023 RepID=UPI00143FE012|nr:hypothetical protein [Saccharopolyspora sp. ASAGF58]QIZ34976.1 hypothetical protein FDZ84_09840 [Saccharopolyspora sp. ASAGF58]